MERRILQEMLNLAKQLACAAGDISLPRTGRELVEYKPDNSPVTEVDRSVQAHIVGAVCERFPDHGVLAEETIPSPASRCDPASARYCWVIDPLDGTRNYISGFPCFTTSLAVLDQGRPVVGVVFEHNLGSVYTAVAGQGAWLNDNPIHVEEVPNDSDMLVAIPSSKDQLTVNVIRNWVATPGIICRNLGATTLHLALVASGALAAAFCKRSKIWDVAAGALLVTEAGGRITDPVNGNPLSFDLTADPDTDLPFLAAAPQTHQRLLGTIQTALK